MPGNFKTPERFSNRQFAVLSGRETEIIRHLMDGATNREIAECLSISRHTVKSHVNSIFNKLSVTNRTHSSVKTTLLGYCNTCKIVSHEKCAFMV